MFQWPCRKTSPEHTVAAFYHCWSSTTLFLSVQRDTRYLLCSPLYCSNSLFRGKTDKWMPHDRGFIWAWIWSFVLLFSQTADLFGISRIAIPQASQGMFLEKEMIGTCVGENVLLWSVPTVGTSNCWLPFGRRYFKTLCLVAFGAELRQDLIKWSFPRCLYIRDLVCSISFYSEMVSSSDTLFHCYLWLASCADDLTMCFIDTLARKHLAFFLGNIRWTGWGFRSTCCSISFWLCQPSNSAMVVQNREKSTEESEVAAGLCGDVPMGVFHRS